MRGGRNESCTQRFQCFNVARSLWGFAIITASLRDALFIVFNNLSARRGVFLKIYVTINASFAESDTKFNYDFFISFWRLVSTTEGINSLWNKMILYLHWDSKFCVIHRRRRCFMYIDPIQVEDQGWLSLLRYSVNVTLISGLVRCYYTNKTLVFVSDSRLAY